MEERMKRQVYFRVKRKMKSIQDTLKNLQGMLKNSQGMLKKKPCGFQLFFLF